MVRMAHGHTKTLLHPVSKGQAGPPALVLVILVSSKELSGGAGMGGGMTVNQKQVVLGPKERVKRKSLIFFFLA